jgi:hypothetical protein
MVFLPSSTLLRAEAAKSYPWPNHGVADIAMYVALALKGWKFWYCGEPLVNYRIHSEQLSSNPLSHRDSLVKLWSSFTFEDVGHEALRAQLLSKAHFSRAGGLIKAGQTSEARADLVRARDLSPQIAGKKWTALWMMSYLPILAFRSASSLHRGTSELLSATAERFSGAAPFSYKCRESNLGKSHYLSLLVRYLYLPRPGEQVTIALTDLMFSFRVEAKDSLGT